VGHDIGETENFSKREIILIFIRPFLMQRHYVLIKKLLENK